MEHKYETPSLSDLEMYFDLTYAFVLALEGYMFMLSSKSEMFFESNDIEKFQGGTLQVRYDFEKPSVIYGLNDGDNKTEVTFEPSNIEDFLFAVKVYFLLCRRTILVNWDLILDEIKGATS